MKRWRELREMADRIAGQLDQLDRRAEKMEVILMVREPAAGAAAEAYDGLRRQVVSAVSERMAHLAQLVQLDAALTGGADAGAVARLVRGFAEQASLERVTDAGHRDRDLLFELVEDLGGRYEVLEPAYVDAITGRLIRRGSMRRADPPDPPDPPGQAGQAGQAGPSGQRQAPWEGL
jgi:hypothetical protein